MECGKGSKMGGVYLGFAFMRPFGSGMIPTMGSRPAKMEFGFVVRYFSDVCVST